MKKLILTVCLSGLLAGCAPPIKDYEPKLVAPAKNADKFHADLADCRYKITHPPANLLYGFGVLGGVAAHATNEDKMYDDRLPGQERMDICMAAKGYKIAGDGR